MREIIENILEKYELVLIKVDDVSSLPISYRTVYMCKFGCDQYGKYPSCPPNTGTPEEIRAFWDSYKKFILVTTKYTWDALSFDEYKRKFQISLINIQKELLTKGWFYAFALFPGSCRLCKECGMPSLCYRPSDVRPAVSGMGVNMMLYLQRLKNELALLNIPLHIERLFSIILLE